MRVPTAECHDCREGRPCRGLIWGFAGGLSRRERCPRLFFRLAPLFSPGRFLPALPLLRGQSFRFFILAGSRPWPSCTPFSPHADIILPGPRTVHGTDQVFWVGPKSSPAGVPAFRRQPLSPCCCGVAGAPPSKIRHRETVDNLRWRAELLRRRGNSGCACHPRVRVGSLGEDPGRCWRA
jgi:hypothetical protein